MNKGFLTTLKILIPAALATGFFYWATEANQIRKYKGRIENCEVFRTDMTGGARIPGEGDGTYFVHERTEVTCGEERTVYIDKKPLGSLDDIQVYIGILPVNDKEILEEKKQSFPDIYRKIRQSIEKRNRLERLLNMDF